MKAISRFAVLALIAVVPAVALAARSSRQVRVTSTCTKEQFKPKGIVLACGDGNTYLQRLSWSSWTTRRAKGSGTLTENTCTPSCAAGRPVSYPVAVVLTRPRSCKRQAHRTFTEAKLTYTGARPRQATTRYRIFCPI